MTDPIIAWGLGTVPPAKAGALILAEIERLDRAALRGEVKP